MNTADRSLSMVDYALRRRFSFIELEPGFESATFEEYLKANGAPSSLVEAIRNRMKGLNQMISDDTTGLGRGYRIGHSFFVPSTGHPADESWMEDIVECEIIPRLEEYWCDDSVRLDQACRIARGSE